MALELPRRRIENRQIQIPQRQVPFDQILAVESQNPLAQAISTTGNVIGDVLQKRAEKRKEGEELAALEKQAGVPAGSYTGLKPEIATSLAETHIKQQTEGRKIPLGQPLTNKSGKSYQYFYDQKTNEITPRELSLGVPPPKSLSGGGVSQTQFVDSSDSTPLFLDKATHSYIRSDGQPLRGNAVPIKGNQEAAQSTSRSLEILPKVDILFDALNAKSELTARASTTPGIGKIFYPEINQLKSEMEQVGFSFGGKNYTGTEKGIITDALIPGPFDNAVSREQKRRALKGYLTGQIDLVGAANLLGSGGNKIKEVISGKTSLKKIGTESNGLSPEKQKRLDELRRKRSQGTLR